jgi:hypothetical protein
MRGKECVIMCRTTILALVLCAVSAFACEPTADANHPR